MSESKTSDWATHSLGTIAELRRGITYTSSSLVAEGDGLPYINMKSFLKGGGFNTEGIKNYKGFYTASDLAGKRDLFLANTDVTAGDIVGVPALLPSSLKSEKVLYSHHVTRLRLDRKVTAFFLYYLLCLPEYRSWMLKFARGTTVLMLDMEALKRIPIRAPKDTHHQNLITDFLWTVDKTIEHTEVLIEKYEQVRAGLIQDLFTRGVTSSGELRPSRLEAPLLYKKSVIGWIPKEWDVVPLEDLCTNVVDCPHSTPSYLSAGVPCIRTADMRPGRLLLEQAYKVSETTYRERVIRLEPRHGDIIYSREGERLGIASPVGRDRVCLGQRVMMLRPRPKTDSIYLCWAMNTPGFYRRVVAGLGATTSPHVNVGDIRRLPLHRPNFVEQESIGNTMRAMDKMILTEESRCAKLRKLKAGLMNDLLIG
jgi:type I restriction enzyme, S subunit